MASVGKYSGEALATMEKIMATITAYTVNKVYKNQEHNIYWFINQNGYMHILRPCNVRLDGKHLYFAIEDYLLTKNNMLQIFLLLEYQKSSQFLQCYHSLLLILSCFYLHFLS